MIGDYHVNPETGEASPCTAKYKCYFTIHAGSLEEARKEYEIEMAWGAVTSISKTSVSGETAATNNVDPMKEVDVKTVIEQDSYNVWCPSCEELLSEKEFLTVKFQSKDSRVCPKCKANISNVSRGHLGQKTHHLRSAEAKPSERKIWFHTTYRDNWADSIHDAPRAVHLGSRASALWRSSSMNEVSRGTVKIYGVKLKEEAGLDDTLYEDTNMVYLEQMPAGKKAAAYINSVEAGGSVSAIVVSQTFTQELLWEGKYDELSVKVQDGSIYEILSED